MIKGLILALALLPSLCIGAGGDLLIVQRLPDDSSQINRLVVKPVGANDGVMGFLGSTQRPSFLQLGQGLQLSGGVLSAVIPAPTWASVTGKPDFSVVATTGAYSDLSGRPVIPSAQVASDWLASSGPSQILNKPVLFSGAYADLTGKPVLFNGAYSSLSDIPSTFAPAPHNQAWSTITATPTTLGGYGITDGLTASALAPYATSSSLASGLAGKLNTPSGTTAQYLRGDGTLAAFPSIPAAQVQSDWNAVSAPAAILNKPALFSGAYGALTGIPTTFAPAAHTQAWSTITATPTTVSGYGLTDAATTTQLAAKFNTPSGTTAQYVRGDGSLATLPTAKRIETYTGTTNASGQVTVVYPTAFPLVPNVQTPPPALPNQVWTLTSSTANGFTAVLSQRNVVTLLAVEVLLGAVVPVNGSAAQIVVIER